MQTVGYCIALQPAYDFSIHGGCLYGRGITCCLRADVKIYHTKYDQSLHSGEQLQLLVTRGSWRYLLISVPVGAGFVFAFKSRAEVGFIVCPGVWGLCVHQGGQNLDCSMMVAFITRDHLSLPSWCACTVASEMILQRESWRGNWDLSVTSLCKWWEHSQCSFDTCWNEMSQQKILSSLLNLIWQKIYFMSTEVGCVWNFVICAYFK